MKKFELSAYEVEEMDQKELIEVKGGVDPITIWIAGVALVFTIYQAILMTYQILRDSNGVPGETNEIEFKGIADETGFVRIACPKHGIHEMRVMPGQEFIIKCSWIQEY